MRCDVVSWRPKQLPCAPTDGRAACLFAHAVPCTTSSHLQLHRSHATCLATATALTYQCVLQHSTGIECQGLLSLTAANALAAARVLCTTHDYLQQPHTPVLGHNHGLHAPILQGRCCLHAALAHKQQVDHHNNRSNGKTQPFGCRLFNIVRNHG